MAVQRRRIGATLFLYWRSPEARRRFDDAYHTDLGLMHEMEVSFFLDGGRNVPHTTYTDV